MEARGCRLRLPSPALLGATAVCIVAVCVAGLHSTSLGLDLRFKTPFGTHQGWKWAHAAFHFAVALTMPEFVPVALLGGVAWEVFEYVMGSLDAHARRCAAAAYGLPEPDCTTLWMQASGEDLLFNSFGAVAGLTALAAANAFRAPSGRSCLQT